MEYLVVPDFDTTDWRLEDDREDAPSDADVDELDDEDDSER